jgi:arylsulfatase A-like enzyme
MNRRDFLATTGSAATGVLASPLVTAEGQSDRRPNVIFILTDDQNNDTMGCFGGNALTPTMDRLAAEGARLTRAYACASVCAPSRYTCLTGQYASRCDSASFMRGNPPGAQSNVSFNTHITPDTVTVGRALRDAGYATGLVGKWHTGNPPLLPFAPDADMRDPKVADILAENQQRMCEYIRGCGFDYAASIYKGNLKDHKLDALDVHNQEWVTKGALDFIERNSDRPFYLHVATTLHHSPSPFQSLSGDPRVTPAGLLDEPLDVQAPRSSIAPRLRDAGIPEQMGHATWLDDAVDALVKKLDELEILDNTAIILFSDNGTLAGKGTCYEGGAHTPAFMWWPGHISAGNTCDELISTIDFVPTTFDICGVTPPEEMHVDGVSLLPMLSGRDTKWRDALFLEIGHTRAVCTERWKYVALRYPPALQEKIDADTLGRPPYHMDTVIDLEKRAAAEHPGYFDLDQLYDLENDPDEKNNLAGDPKYAEVLTEMKARLTEWLGEFPRPFGEFTT